MTIGAATNPDAPTTAAPPADPFNAGVQTQADMMAADQKKKPSTLAQVGELAMIIGAFVGVAVLLDRMTSKGSAGGKRGGILRI